MTAKCPRCDSSAPHLHPAVQHGGEVQICPHEFHLRETVSNTPDYIAAVKKMREREKGKS